MLTIDVPQNIHGFAKTNICRPFRGDSDSEKADAYPVDWPPQQKINVEIHDMSCFSFSSDISGYSSHSNPCMFFISTRSFSTVIGDANFQSLSMF